MDHVFYLDLELIRLRVKLDRLDVGDKHRPLGTADDESGPLVLPLVRREIEHEEWYTPPHEDVLMIDLLSPFEVLDPVLSQESPPPVVGTVSPFGGLLPGLEGLIEVFVAPAAPLQDEVKTHLMMPPISGHSLR